MNNDPWDDLPSGEYVKWSEPGDTVVGVVVSKSIGFDLNQRPCPQLTVRLDDGTDRIVSASQAQLAARLKELRPAVGQKVRIVYTGDERREGGKTLKLFTVDVKGEPAPVEQVPEEEPF